MEVSKVDKIKKMLKEGTDNSLILEEVKDMIEEAYKNGLISKKKCIEAYQSLDEYVEIIDVVEEDDEVQVICNDNFAEVSFSLRIPNIKFSKFLDKVKKEMEEIEKYAKIIEAINEENIEKLDDIQLYNESSTFAKKVLEKVDLKIYKSPYDDINENIKKMLKARNEKEFLKYLKEYKKEMKAWALEELKVFLYPDENINVNIDKVYKQAKGKLSYEINCNVGDIAKVNITIKKGKEKIDKEEFLLSLGEKLKELYEENKNKVFYYRINFDKKLLEKKKVIKR